MSDEPAKPDTPGAPKIVPLFKPANEACVKMLREALKDAEAGTLVEVAYVARLNSGGVEIRFTPTENQFERVGHVHRLLYRLLKRMDE